MQSLDGILLGAEQQQLLITFVEAFRKAPKPEAFQQFREGFDDMVYHKGLHSNKGIKVRWHNVELLASERMLTLNHHQNNYTFDITPVGFKYYEHLMQQAANPCNRVEQSVRSFLEVDVLLRFCPSAYEKWMNAEMLLWGENPEKRTTDIGHHCREAIQEFAGTLIKKFKIIETEPNPAKSVARLKAVLSVAKNELGETKHAFLDALLAYWGTTIDLIQRQVHGATRENETLTWDDSRRAVFHTGILMYEFSTVLLIKRS